MIGENVKRTIGVPDYYFDEYNSTPMINFWGAIDYILRTFRPAHVCEIGSERGITSSRLARLLPETQISIVDPCVQGNVKTIPNVTPYEETSKAFLERELPIPFYIIDGDHNYETVTLELEGALANAPADTPFCALFHDVGWPFARRDGYYDPATVETPKPHRYDIALKLEDDEMHEGPGWENGRTFALAEEYGGERNGVLTAIEDFVVQQGEGWHYLQVPIFYGLGIVWCDKHMSAADIQRMEVFRQALDIFRPVFACGEANRLRLVQGLNEYRARTQIAEEELRPWQEIPFRRYLRELRRRWNTYRGK